MVDLTPSCLRTSCSMNAPDPARGAGCTDSQRLAFLRVIGAPEPRALRDAMNDFPLDEADVEWLSRQGLAPFVYHVLTRNQATASLSPGTVAGLRRTTIATASASLQKEQELTAILRLLAEKSVDSVLLKGSVLAYTVYPEPWCRPRCDVDVWIDPSDYPSVREGLTALGYREQPPERRPLSLALAFGGETQFRGDGNGLGLVEPHFKAFVGEWVRYATKIDQSALWDRRIPFHVAGVTGKSMTPEDMLLHLCVHFGVTHQFASPALRALLDIHLMSLKAGLDWATVARRAREWRTATVTWTVLSLAVRFFASPVPIETLRDLEPGRTRRSIIRRLHLDEGIAALRPGGYTPRRGVIWLVMTDRVGSLSRFLFRVLFPESGWLRCRYGAERSPVLPLLFRHWTTLVLHHRS